MLRITALLLALGACHSSMGDMSSMRGYVEDTRRETTRHVDAARVAVSMDAMRAELEHHRTAMLPMMADMDEAMEGMASHCDGLGLGEMRAMHDELDAEVMQHLATMTVASDLAPAMAEVERHASAVMSMMEGMNGAMGHMTCR